MSVARLSREAIDELVEAAEWYRAQRPGLESELLDEVERILPLIASAPASFIQIGDDVEVLAVAHTKRRPGYWLDRIEGRQP